MRQDKKARGKETTSNTQRGVRAKVETGGFFYLGGGIHNQHVNQQLNWLGKGPEASEVMGLQEGALE
jgi:hypothetical protein